MPKNKIVYSRSPEKIDNDKTSIPDEVYDSNKDSYNLVVEILKGSLVSRNNDVWLMILCWLKQGIIKKVEVDGEEGFLIPKESLFELEKPSTIFRKRREIQNKEGKYLPTDSKVIAARKIKQEQIKQFYLKK